jgi:hypothetical protein
MLLNGCPLCRSTMGRFSIIVDFTETFATGLLPSICVKRNGEVKTVVVSERTLRAISRSISKAHDNMLLPCRSGKLRTPTTTAAHLCPQLYLQRKHIHEVDLMRTEAMSEITDCVINFLKTVSELAPSGSFMKAFLGGTRKSIYFTGGITNILHPTFSVVVREHLCLPDENKLDYIEVRDEVMDVWELWSLKEATRACLLHECVQYDTTPEETGMIFAKNVLGCWENCHELTTPYGSFVAAHWRVYMFASTTTERYIDPGEVFKALRESHDVISWRACLERVCPALIAAAWEALSDAEKETFVTL